MNEDEKHTNQGDSFPGKEMISGPRLYNELKLYRTELEMQNDELRRTEARLRESSERYADLYDFAPSGYMTLTGRGIIKDLNLKASVHLAKDRASSIATSFSDYLDERSKGTLRIHLLEALNSKSSVKCDVRIAHPEKPPIDVQMESSCWWDRKSERALIRCILTDITDRLRLERELTEARQKAEAANTAKGHFLSNMSHEIRTPLGIMICFAEIMLFDSREDQVEHLQTIQRNGRQLLALVDEILDLSKIEANQMSIEKLSMSIREEIGNLIQQLKPRADEKDIRLSVEIAENVPRGIFSDPGRFRQVLLNLIGNALKFTSEGQVQVSAWVTASPEGDFLKITVSDTGCGITAEQQKNLFNPFTQADASTTRKYGGTGLGLCISRRMAELLGGSATLLHSEPDVGSTFQFELPLLVPAGEEFDAKTEEKSANLAKDERKLGLRGLKVLLVEDSLDNQNVYRTYLETAGIKVDIAEDGAEGIEAAMNGRYDLILMDIQLPILDGITATAYLREHGLSAPIFALTAYA